MFTGREFPGIQGEGTRNLSFDGAPVIEYAGEILKDWGFGVDSSHRNCDYYNSKYLFNSMCDDKGTDYGFFEQVKREHPGKWLAKMLENELSGAVTIHNGDYFRR
jgi:hypothetical protein